MTKTTNPRRVGLTEARAKLVNVRISPQKLNLVAQSIRGLPVQKALNELEFSRKRIATDVRKVLYSAVSNADHMNQNLGKAGRVRHMGFRPHVRGVAMNPIDHPHGGGEGRTSGGRTPVTPWGKDTKGTRTRKNKATDKFIIRTRHVKKAR